MYKFVLYFKKSLVLKGQNGVLRKKKKQWRIEKSELKIKIFLVFVENRQGIRYQIKIFCFPWKTQKISGIK